MNFFALKSLIRSIGELKEKHDAGVITSKDDMLKKFISFAIDKGLGRYLMQLKPTDGPCSVYSSKLGGIPYMPKDFEYPVNGDNQPLRLLCQLNFEKLPPMKPCPEKGILQIYLYDGNKQDLFDYQGTSSKQDDFRIIYFEDVLRRESMLKSAEEMPSFNNDAFPAEKERMLTAKAPTPSIICSADYRFGETVLEFAKKYKMCPKSAKSLNDIPNDADEPLYNQFTYQGLICIGGSGIFTEGDPRKFSPEYQDCDISLFSLGDNEKDIQLNFLMPSANMMKRDFTKVLFDMNWNS